MLGLGLGLGFVFRVRVSVNVFMVWIRGFFVALKQLQVGLF